MLPLPLQWAGVCWETQDRTSRLRKELDRIATWTMSKDRAFEEERSRISTFHNLLAHQSTVVSGLLSDINDTHGTRHIHHNGIHHDNAIFPGGKLNSKLKRLKDRVHESINKLGTTPQELITLEFNLVSIHEAHQSTSASLSMKRLSWVTFLFLPLIFVSGLLGMNVDLIQGGNDSYPRWWWYIVLSIIFLCITCCSWIIFRYKSRIWRCVACRRSDSLA